MKLTMPTIGVLASIVVLASVGAMYTVAFESDLSLVGASNPTGAAYMVGNVKVTQFDEFGNVIAYRQGSNHITATGMQIIMAQVFSGVNKTEFTDSPGTGLGNNITGRVGWMEIGTGGDPVTYQNKLRYNDTDINTPVGEPVPGNPCIRVRAAITNSTAVGVVAGDFRLAHEAGSFCNTPQLGKSVDACSARMNVTAIAQFDGTECQINSIDEAGIFTSNTAEDRGLMFARNTFGSVNLGALDTLQLEWEFTFTDS